MAKPITLTLSPKQFHTLVNVLALAHMDTEDLLEKAGPDDPYREEEIDRERDIADILNQLEDQEPEL